MLLYPITAGLFELECAAELEPMKLTLPDSNYALVLLPIENEITWETRKEL